MSHRAGWAVMLRFESGPRRDGSAGPGGLVGTLGSASGPGRECGGPGQEALTGGRSSWDSAYQHAASIPRLAGNVRVVASSARQTGPIPGPGFRRFAFTRIFNVLSILIELIALNAPNSTSRRKSSVIWVLAYVSRLFRLGHRSSLLGNGSECIRYQ